MNFNLPSPTGYHVFITTSASRKEDVVKVMFIAVWSDVWANNKPMVKDVLRQNASYFYSLERAF